MKRFEREGDMNVCCRILPRSVGYFAPVPGARRDGDGYHFSGDGITFDNSDTLQRKTQSGTSKSSPLTTGEC